MAERRRLIKEMLDSAKKNIQFVAHSAKHGLTTDELGLLDEAVFLIIEAENKIVKIKEEFIKTIDECNL